MSACHCFTCGADFNSLDGFDAHLTGPLTSRHHLTAPEMTAAGWKLNAYRRWVRRPLRLVPQFARAHTPNSGDRGEAVPEVGVWKSPLERGVLGDTP